jgi:hypothetical protein
VVLHTKKEATTMIATSVREWLAGDGVEQTILGEGVVASVPNVQRWTGFKVRRLSEDHLLQA